MNMEIEKKITYGIVGTFAAIILLTVVGVYLSQEQIDNGYVCTGNDMLGIFNGSASHPAPLSGTSRSGYYIDSTGRNRRATCYGGTWQPLAEYLKSTGKTLDDLRKFEPDELAGINEAIRFDTSYFKSCINIIKSNYTRYTISVVHTCDTSKVPMINLTNNLTDAIPINASCYGGNYSETHIVNNPYTVRKCKRIGMVIDGKSYKYKREGIECRGNATVTCCWDIKHGGTNLDARAPEYQLAPAPGETDDDVQCGEITKTKAPGEFKQRGVLK